MLKITKVFTFGLRYKRAKQWGMFDGLNPKNNTLISKSKIVQKIQKHTEKILLGNALLSQVRKQLMLLKQLRTYKGVRHIVKLPCRGQHTQTNAKTKKKFKC